MRALVWNGEALRIVPDYPQPKPPVGEALIQVLMAGICNTDIEITRGYLGFTGILGHEFVGTVTEINDDDQSWIGKRVVGDINCACAQTDCVYCNQDLGRHCSQRTTLGIVNRDGCFAEYLTLPVRNLHEVPAAVSTRMATFTEPLAAGFEILEQIHIASTDKVLIVGDGKLGLLINHALTTTGAAITQVGKHPHKLALAQANGCETVLLDAKTQSRLAQQFDVVIEATGSAGGFNFSLACTRPRGKLILKSTIAASHSIDLTPLVVNEITVIGSRCGLFSPALSYLASGAELTPLVSHVFPFEQSIQAFTVAKTKGELKVLLDFSSSDQSSSE